MTDRIVLKWAFMGSEMGGMMLPGPVVAVGWQWGRPTVWIEHVVEARKVDRRFIAIPTGEAFPFGAPHVGSAISDEIVLHVYEVTNTP